MEFFSWVPFTNIVFVKKFLILLFELNKGCTTRLFGQFQPETVSKYFFDLLPDILEFPFKWPSSRETTRD